MFSTIFNFELKIQMYNTYVFITYLNYQWFSFENLWSERDEAESIKISGIPISQNP